MASSLGICPHHTSSVPTIDWFEGYPVRPPVTWKQAALFGSKVEANLYGSAGSSRQCLRLQPLRSQTGFHFGSRSVFWLVKEILLLPFGATSSCLTRSFFFFFFFFDCGARMQITQLSTCSLSLPVPHPALGSLSPRAMASA